jgi:hypothetical protein
MSLVHCFTLCFWKLLCLQNFRSDQWGSSLAGLHTLDPPLGPASTWAEIFPCKQLPQPLRTNIQSFGTLRQLSNVILKPKNISRGPRGGSPIFVWLMFYFIMSRNPSLPGISITHREVLALSSDQFLPHWVNSLQPMRRLAETHTRPSALPPIDTSENFLSHVSAE